MAIPKRGFESMYKACLEILEEDKFKCWEQGDLVKAILVRTEMSSEGIAAPIVKTLVLSGAVKGTMWGQNAKNICYKDPAERQGSEERSEPMVPKRSFEEAMSRFKADMQRLQEQHVKAQSEFQAKITEAEKAAAEAKGKERIVKVVVESFRDGKKKAEKEHVATFHSQFERLTKLVQARENVFIYGPTGSGKTFIAKQLADIVQLPFYFLSCSQGMSEASLAGRLLPGKGGNFEYWESEFVKAYENGGIFLIDEIDAADANVLLIVNSALANNRFAIPGRRDKPYAERHPDFICIAAANTLGTGSDRMYAGRSKLDVSTLDRFGIGKVFIDYDDAVETTLCPDEALRKHLLRYRKAINANRLERAMSSRFMEKAFKMHSEYGYSFGDIDETYFLGWREDEINKVKSFR